MKAKTILKKGMTTFAVVMLLCIVAAAQEHESPLPKYSKSTPDAILNSNSRYIAVFGDIQNYITTKTNVQYYIESLEWIASHAGTIRFMMHTGDVTNNNYVSQWELFHSTTSPIAEVLPFYTCIGNHDYICNAPNIWNHRDSTRFSDYVGFPTTASHIAAYYAPGHYENILIREELFENDPIYLLILELEPRRAVVRWADSLVQTIPDDRIILITHRFVNANGNRYRNKNYMTDSESSAPQYVWDSLIFRNDNIRCVLCGHVSSQSRVLYSTNSKGRIVPQIEFNIQRQPHGGNGLIELWEFDREGDVFVRTYNTHTERFANDSISEFQFKFR